MRTPDLAPSDVQVLRLLHAPIHRLFAAWVEPDSLAQWWGPDDVTTHELILEPRVGGTLRWSLTDSDGSPVTVRGEVTELVHRERIAFTWMPEGRGWERPSRVTVDFREARGVIVRVLHQDLPDLQARNRHEKGWSSALDRFERWINPAAAGPRPHKPRQSYSIQQKAAPIRMRDGGQR